MAHEEFEQNVALYTAGALDPLERQALEAHLAEGCQLCLATLREYQETAGLLPHGLPLTAPPPALKGRIETAALAQVLAQPAVTNTDATLRTADVDATLRTPDPPVVVPSGDVTIRLPSQPAGTPVYDATVRMTHQQAAQAKAVSGPSRQWPRFARPALAAASVALVLGIGLYAYSLKSKLAAEIAHRQAIETALQQHTLLAGVLRQKLTQAQQDLVEFKQRTLPALQDQVAQREMDIERLRTQVTQKEQELVVLYKTASPKDEMLAMLQSANVRVLSLAGTDAAKSAGGLVLYDPERGKAFLYAFNMPALPRGKVYQLWTITTKPVSAGTFSADTGRKCRHLAHSLPAKSGITKFAVSVEPEGGKPQPTGAIYLHGSL